MVGFDNTREQLNAWEYSFAGACAGAITRFLGQPFDVIKTRFQLQVEPISRSSSTSTYSSVFQAFSKIMADEGINGLWKGHLSGQLLSITYGIAQFQAFEITTKLFEQYFKSESRTTQVHALCGTIAGGFATVFSFPFDVLRTRFIAQGNEKLYSSLHHGIALMIKEEGPLSLFKGLTPALLLTAPQAGAMFAFHNVFSSMYKGFTEKRDLDVTGNLVVGGLAGIFGKSCVYPLDLSRKRLQMQGFQGRKGFGENFTCGGLLSCLVLTSKNEGFLALFKGLSPSILKAAVTTALHFTAYEETCKLLKKRKSRQP